LIAAELLMTHLTLPKPDDARLLMQAVRRGEGLGVAEIGELVVGLLPGRQQALRGVLEQFTQDNAAALRQSALVKDLHRVLSTSPAPTTIEEFSRIVVSVVRLSGAERRASEGTEAAHVPGGQAQFSMARDYEGRICYEPFEGAGVCEDEGCSPRGECHYLPKLKELFEGDNPCQCILDIKWYEWVLLALLLILFALTPGPDEIAYIVWVLRKLVIGLRLAPALAL
jgi:hypothetical protein